MRTKTMLAGAMLAACTFTFAQAQDAASTDIDPKAKALIKKMGDFYKSLKGASFKATMKVAAPDMPFPMSQASAVSVAKPNLFVSDAEESMMGGLDAASNGKEMIVALPMFDIYQEVKAPDSFDSLLPKTEEDMMNMDESLMPLAQDPALIIGLMLFAENPTRTLLENVTSLTIEGEEEFAGQEAVRLNIASDNAGINPTTDAELWIAKGEKPWLLGVRPDLEAMMGEAPDDAMAQSMELTLQFDNWKSDRPADGVFALSPDENWERVDDLMAAVMEKAAQQMADMNMDDFEFGDDPAGAEGGFDAPKHPTIGTEAPAFTLKTLRTDKEVTLASLKGKVVVLDFWATWCSPCVAGLPTVDKVTTAFKDRGVEFYAIDLREPADRVQKFVDKKKWTFPVLMDGDGSIAKEYGVNGIPHSVIIGADGKILNVHVGFGGAKALEAQLTEELEAALAEVSTQG